MVKNTDNAQTCRTCGALVDSDMTGKHGDWHRRIEGQATAAAEEAVKVATKKAERQRRGGAQDGWR